MRICLGQRLATGALACGFSLAAPPVTSPAHASGEIMRNPSRSRYGMRAFALFAMFLLAAVVAPLAGASAWTYDVLYNFCSQANCADGGNPQDLLLMDAAGNLYGTTVVAGGTNLPSGTVFELVKNGTSYDYKILYSFCAKRNCSDGRAPAGGLIMDAAGDLYGTTHSGGKNDGGTAFELKPPSHSKSNWVLITLYAFCGAGLPACSDGSSPTTALTYQGKESGVPYDGTSPLLGTTGRGGSQNGGVAFQLTGSHHNTYKVIYTFCSQPNCSDGASPNELTDYSATGQFYGTTYTGGANGAGMLFALTPSGTGYAESIVYNFCQLAQCADGANPFGALSVDLSGGLEGVTLDGGGCVGGPGTGAIYGWAPQYELFGSFGGFCDATAGPRGKMVPNYYRAAIGISSAGSDVGAVWSFDWINDSVSTIYTFCSQQPPLCTDGTSPVGGVVQDASGNLFGMTAQGGASNYGVIFELSP